MAKNIFVLYFSHKPVESEDIHKENALIAVFSLCYTDDS